MTIYFMLLNSCLLKLLLLYLSHGYGNWGSCQILDLSLWGLYVCYMYLLVWVCMNMYM